MINLFNTHIETLLFIVGNKSRNEAIFLSEQPLVFKMKLCLIKEFFLKPLEKKKKTIFSLRMKI
jgi:hypothetical protein